MLKHQPLCLLRIFSRFNARSERLCKHLRWCSFAVKIERWIIFFLCFFFFFSLQNICKINSSNSWADCVIDSADTLSCVDVYFFPPHLEDVFTGAYVSNVDPLAVNIVAVGVPAANWDTLLSHIIAGIPLMDTWWEQTHWNTWGETKKKNMMCKFSVKCLGLKLSGLFLGDCQKNRKDLSCVKLSGCLWSQDQFRLGLWSYSPLLTLSAHYGISALHLYVFLIPLFVTNGPLLPDLPQKSRFMLPYHQGSRCPPDRSWLCVLRPPWTHWGSADRSGWTPRCCGSAWGLDQDRKINTWRK